MVYNPTDCDFILQDKERESVLLTFSDAGYNIKVDCTISENVVFGEIRPVQGKNVLVTLNEQIRLVENIVCLFKRQFF